MSKLSQFFLTLVMAVAVAWGAVHFYPGHQTETAAKEPVYARVMRTGILRCGYLIYPPETIKDPNTGKLSGFIVEITEEAARQLGWKVEWTAEVGFQDMFEGLKTGRYDALCVGIYEKPDRAKQAMFTIPIDYGVTYTVVRADDTRFDASLDLINDPKIKIAQIDGEISQVIAHEVFPKAEPYALSSLSDISLIAEAVADRKADIGFMTIANARTYMEHNPGKLKVLRKIPSRVYPSGLMALPNGEYGLKYLIDATTRDLLESHFVERTIRKYEPKLETYLMLAKPYEINQ